MLNVKNISKIDGFAFEIPSNLYGRKQFFNDYLYDSLNKLDDLNLTDEFINTFSDFKTRYSKYNDLDINQRKRLVIDTRKSLFKLGKSIDTKFSSKNTNTYYSKDIDSNLCLESDISLIKSIGKVNKNNWNDYGLKFIDLIYKIKSKK